MCVLFAVARITEKIVQVFVSSSKHDNIGIVAREEGI